ncbi:MAG: ABC transporter ATP-binding protein [Candidatus Limnocylindrales bacterium]
MADTPMVQIEDLHKQYVRGAPEAVAGISLVIERGEVFGLLGPNGAGKTTTVGVVTTRVRPTSGRVLVDGIDVVGDPVAIRTRIAVVPQRANFDRSLTAIENLTFHAAYFGVAREERGNRARELLATFGLQGRENDDVMQYSGGMAQRLMIARALMHEPMLLVLDEPTTSLDPQGRLFLQDRIAELKQKGLTVLLCTHDMVEADRLCDRIAIVDHGGVIALDTPRGLRSLLPGSRGFELTLRGAPPDIADRLFALAGAGRIETLPPPVGSGESGADSVGWPRGGPSGGAGAGWSGTGSHAVPAVADTPRMLAADRAWRGRIYAADSGEAGLLPRVIAAAADGGAEIVDLHRVEGTLEDVFIHLTGRELR